MKIDPQFAARMTRFLLDEKLNPQPESECRIDAFVEIMKGQPLFLEFLATCEAKPKEFTEAIIFSAFAMGFRAHHQIGDFELGAGFVHLEKDKRGVN